MIDVGKILTGVAIALLTALLTFAYTELLSVSDRVLGLEKDKEHLLPQYNKRLERLERIITNNDY